MSMTDKTCAEFVAAIATKAPVPGGGGASALCGAIGTALGNMVGCLTVGKKKYAAVEPEIRDCMAKCDAIQADLLTLVELDAEVFTPLAAAYGLPKDTEEQRVHKAAVMEEALKSACEVPLEIMKKCCAAIDLAAIFAAKGSVIAVSDAGVSAALCKAALESAALNVFINTKAMANRDRAASFDAEADEILRVYRARASEIYDAVAEKLRP